MGSATRTFAGRAPSGTRRLLGVLTVLAVTALPCRAQEAAPSEPSSATTLGAPSPASQEAPLAPPEAPPASAGARALSDDGPPPLHDLSGWLDYRSRHHIASLPLEARLFYRRGVLAYESGNRAEAARLVRGASELDPSYVAPHLTLASWTLLHEPSQTLFHYGTVLELARQNFLLQLALSANSLYAALLAVFLGMLATALLIVALRQGELRHMWREHLARWVGPTSARVWPWVLLFLPFCLGLGPVLPTLVLMGLLWPVLRGRERFVFVALVASLASLPWVTGALDRLTLPLDEARGPLYGVAMVETEPGSPERAAQLQALAAQHPQNGFTQFAAGWTARRSGDLANAEQRYRRTLALWPGDDRVLNNLGNTLMMQGRSAEALELYQQAVKAEPGNAAAWFNQSQVYTQRFDYRAATDALSRASALNFDLVKSTQSQATEDGMLPLVDQWIAPPRFWQALSARTALAEGHGALPPAWRSRLETRGWPFTVALLLLVGASVWAGLRQHRHLPLRTCSNCGAVVCRRCAERRRELALCPACVEVEKRAESPDFARVLLLQHRRRRERSHHLVRTAFATLVPGLGLLAFRRAFTPIFLLVITAALVGSQLGTAPPFAFEPRLAVSGSELPWPLQLALWVVIYAWSLLGYFRLVARAQQQASQIAAPVRSRAVQATTHVPPAAAA